jgi:thiol-disulfide isomerase/thioredoxin
MKKLFFAVFLAGCFFCCTTPKKHSPLREGIWRGILTLNDTTELILPFNFDLTFQNDSTRITIHNAEERIAVTEISFKNDSIIIQMPVFDSEFRCKITGDTLLTGNWINHARNKKNTIPFTAIYGQTNRFDCPETDTNYPFEGKWKCLFNPTLPDSSYAIGVFKQSAHTVTGTFLTETGDYRYLEGSVFGKYMLLSCFDGSHAYVFHAEIMEDSTIWGEFYSGIHSHETWIAWKDAAFKLRNADSLTFLKTGSPKLELSFPNTENKKVSLSDEKYKNKVVILQIMGSWCPNCMDETKFLSDFYKEYSSQGLEIIALAFEKAEVPEKAKNNLYRLKKKYHADYEFLLTGFPPKEADKALPMLNHVMGFPTTIFIDKKGNVRKIRTGYSGPATGEEHEKFVKEIDSFVEGLLKES